MAHFLSLATFIFWALFAIWTKSRWNLLLKFIWLAMALWGSYLLIRI